MIAARGRWYASHNKFLKNKAVGSRYSLHFMYANQNLVENNEFIGNTVGMFFMYSAGSTVRSNLVMDSDGAFGIGIGLKDVSDFTIENNTLIYNARAFYLITRRFNQDLPSNFTKIKFYTTWLVSIFTLHKAQVSLKTTTFIGNNGH